MMDDRQQAMDAEMWRECERMTAGADAWHALDPAELCMLAEEAGTEADQVADREALREEVFSGFMEYLFGDGPDPVCVRARVAGMLECLAPVDFGMMRGALTWVHHRHVEAVLRRRAARLEVESGRARLSAWLEDLRGEKDVVCVGETIGKMIELLTSEGHRWRSVVAMCYALAKALRPHLIGGMSLADVAVLGGDGGRATPCARVRRIYNKRVEQSGAKAPLVYYQKTKGAAAAYAEAQAGNRNRAKRKGVVRGAAGKPN
jgi:hypothetical protein